MLKAAAVQMDTTEMEDSKRREMKKPKNIFDFVKRCFVKRGGIFFFTRGEREKNINIYKCMECQGNFSILIRNRTTICFKNGNWWF